MLIVWKIKKHLLPRRFHIFWALNQLKISRALDWLSKILALCHYSCHRRLKNLSSCANKYRSRTYLLSCQSKYWSFPFFSVSLYEKLRGEIVTDQAHWVHNSIKKIFQSILDSPQNNIFQRYLLCTVNIFLSSQTLIKKVFSYHSFVEK